VKACVLGEEAEMKAILGFGRAPFFFCKCLFLFFFVGFLQWPFPGFFLLSSPFFYTLRSVFIVPESLRV